MKVWVGAEFSPIKAGIEAYSPDLKCVGHGQSESEAMDSLRRGVQVFLHGLVLDGQGREVEVLNKSGLAWEESGEGIEVIVEAM